MKPSKCPAKKRKEERRRLKQKVKVTGTVSLINSKTVSELYFLHIPKYLAPRTEAVRGTTLSNSNLGSFLAQKRHFSTKFPGENGLVSLRARETHFP